MQLRSLLLPLFTALTIATRADIVIDEIMYHPSSENPAQEYIELYNSGVAPVTLTGWQFTSGVTFTFPVSSIPAGGYLVVAANAAAFTAKYPGVTNFVAGWTGQLSNSSNTITLRDSLSVKVDEVDYSDDGDWGQRERDALADFGHRGWGWNSDADGLGKSLELINALFDNSGGQNWKPSTTAQGTPGVANSVAAADIAPIITNAEHFPLIPTHTDTVAVYARMTDDHASAITATLHWRLDGAGSFTTAAMFDDGAHGDGAAGDGLFGVNLSVHANGTIVEFYYEAADATGHTRTWPAPAKDYTGTFGQFCNCLYQVDDTMYAGAQPIYHLVMKAADKTELSNINTDTGTPPFAFNPEETNDQTYSHARFNTTFLSRDGTGSKLRYLSGARNRGNSSRQTQPQSFNLSFTNADGWNGIHALNFNTQNTPYQLVGSALFRKAGLAMAESRAIQLRWNAANLTTITGAPAYGFYVCNEALDSDFTDHHFPTDSSGNLYRALRQDEVGGANLRDESNNANPALADPTPYRVNYFKHTNTSEDKWADLIGLTQKLAKGHSVAATYAVSYDADYLSAVQGAVDVFQWMRFMAVSTMADNTETNITNGDGDDYYLYFGVTDPRANLIAYDLDSILGRSPTSSNPTHNLFRMSREDFSPNAPSPVHPFMARPEFARLYFQELKRLLDGPFSAAQLGQTIDETIGGLVDATTLADMKAFNATRTAYVASQLTLSISNISALTTGGTALTITSGYPRSTASTCNLTGKADCRYTASVKVNGVAAAYTPWKVTDVSPFTTSVGDWTASGVVLKPGLNRLLVQTFDASNAETERSFFDVWYDDGSVASVTGALAAGTTTWTAAGGPYQLTGNVTVPATGTLVIEPGTTVYLNSAITLSVTAGGRILAEGTEAMPIRFSRAPGLATNGGSITINGQAGAPETHFYHTYFEFGGNPAVVCAANSNVILDHCEWLRNDTAYLHLDGGSFIVSNCIFPTAAAGTYFEGVHGANAAPPAGGRAIVRDCFFGKMHSISSDYNDVFDFTGGNRSGAILEFYNNVMIGSDDDLLDIDGTDMWVEGNIFMHVHRSGSPDSASAISGGNDGGGGTGSRRAATAIDTGTEQITCGTHGFATGQEVVATALLGNTFPAATPALHDGGPYFVRAVSTTVVKLYLTAANANADTNAINFTGTIGTGVSLSLCKLDGISHITIVGNLFYDLDQAATAKEGNFYTFLNNTVINQNNTGSQDALTGVLNFGDDTYHESGGMYAEGNIIQSAVSLTRNYPGAGLAQTVVWNNNLFPPGTTWAGAGSGNTSADALLNDTAIPTPGPYNYQRVAAQIREKFGLQAGSPASGTGPNGTDKGGIRPLGVSLGGVPVGTTNSTSATITVGTLMTGNGIPISAGGWPGGGSGWTHYQRKLDGGAFGPETPTTTPITLTGLSNGLHTLYVIGRNDAGTYQNSSNLGSNARISSATWVVNTAYVPPAPAPNVRINEVLARNVETLGFDGTFPDIIELHNAGNAPADLSDWGLTDNNSVPYKYSIPNPTTLAAGAYLVIYASNSANVPAPKTGFGLKDTGDTLTLTKSAAQGGTVADVAAFGAQIPDYSIGRRTSDGLWDMCRPAFGAANIVAAQNSLTGLKINEWLADAVTLVGQDFVEIYNPNALPVNIGNCYLSDNPVEYPTRHQIRQLTFLAAGGYTFFKADDDVNQGPDHLNFKLDPLQGEIGLFTPTQVLLDNVVYGPQSTDVSEGRTPNGAATVAFFNQPTPGAPNPGSISGTTTMVNLIPADQSWKYQSSSTDFSATFYPIAYDDTAWPSGVQLLYIENAALTNSEGFVKTTALPMDAGNSNRPFNTTYFRTHFTYSGPLTDVTLTATVMMDDGAVIYLNGFEVARPKMDAGAVTFSTVANTNVGDAGVETISIPTTHLVVGDNVIAVEVHQEHTAGGSQTSSDVVWGMKLDADVPVGTSTVVLNEVLPINGSGAGWIELLNTSNAAIDISDMSLSNDVSDPRKYVFVAGTTIAANSYRVLDCNSALAASATNTHFDLTGNGGGVFLFRKPADSGGLQDSVSYGLQVPDFSLGRSPNGTGVFALNLPTRAALNQAAGLGAITTVKFNEWLVSPTLPPGWFEVFNTGAQPVQLSGNYFTDNLTNRNKFQIPALTFVGGSGGTRWQQWIADNNNTAIPGHVNFTLTANQSIGLFSGSGMQLDARSTGSPGLGISQGLFPDGTGSVQSLTPTPAAANALAALDTDGDGLPDAWETANGLNPNDPNDAALDRDGDGQSNLSEYRAGTDPNNPTSVLTCSIAKVSGVTVVRFTAVANKGYTIQFKNTLLDLTWQKLTDIAADPAVRSMEIPDPAAGGFTTRFYRVVTPVQP